jgi:two-component sensor histidine kinase/PAS domain-containing protein
MLPATLLLLAFLLIAARLVMGELEETRRLELEAGLTAQAEILALLQTQPGLPIREALLKADLGRSLDRLGLSPRQEAVLRPEHFRILGSLPTALGQGDPLCASAACARSSGFTLETLRRTFQEIGQVLRQDINGLHLRYHHDSRIALLGALICGMAGAGLLAARLRATWREARSLAGQAMQARSQVHAIYHAAPIGLALLNADLRVVQANASFATIVALPETILAGLPLASLLPELSKAMMPLLLQAQSGGQALPGQNLVIGSGRGLLPRHYFVTAEPVLGPADAPMLSLVVVDMTDRVAAETGRGDAVAELNHRVKNTLATVQSLAAQTLRGAGHDPQRFAADFSARLGALSRSHELIASAGWSGTTLDQTVRAALLPWLASDRVVMRGPAGLPLRPAQCQALIIAMAELAGNAVQHGALSGGGGRVVISWDTLPNGSVRLSWQERGGPRLLTNAPKRGFGLRFLERGLPHDLGVAAWSELRFDPMGVDFEVRFLPLGALLKILPPQAIAAA